MPTGLAAVNGDAWLALALVVEVLWALATLQEAPKQTAATVPAAANAIRNIDGQFFIFPILFA
jgi:hypothetical protein